MAIARLSAKSGKAGFAKVHFLYILRADKYAYRDTDFVSAANGNLPKWAAHDPAIFWESADIYEGENRNAYREYELALPRELSSEQQLKLVRDFVEMEIGEKHVWSFAIHSPDALDDKVQPHAHLIYCDRLLDAIPRDPDQFFKRYNKKNPDRGGAQKNNFWCDRDTASKALIELRARWEKLTNTALEEAGSNARINMKSYKSQGIDRMPEPKFSPEQWIKPEVKEEVLKLRALRKEAEEAQRNLENLIPDVVLEIQSELLKLKDQTAIPSMSSNTGFEIILKPPLKVEIDQSYKKTNQHTDDQLVIFNILDQLIENPTSSLEIKPLDVSTDFPTVEENLATVDSIRDTVMEADKSSPVESKRTRAKRKKTSCKSLISEEIIGSQLSLWIDTSSIDIFHSEQNRKKANQLKIEETKKIAQERAEHIDALAITKSNTLKNENSIKFIREIERNAEIAKAHAIEANAKDKAENARLAHINNLNDREKTARKAWTDCENAVIRKNAEFAITRKKLEKEEIDVRNEVIEVPHIRYFEDELKDLDRKFKIELNALKSDVTQAAQAWIESRQKLADEGVNFEEIARKEHEELGFIDRLTRKKTEAEKANLDFEAAQQTLINYEEPTQQHAENEKDLRNEEGRSKNRAQELQQIMEKARMEDKELANKKNPSDNHYKIPKPKPWSSELDDYDPNP